MNECRDAEFGECSAWAACLAPWVNASGSAGIILAVGLVSLLTLCFGTARFQNWLWRVAFQLSVVPARLGTYVRMRLDESRLFKAVQSEKRIVTVPLLCVLLDRKRQPHWRSG
jgi:MFS family permease